MSGMGGEVRVVGVVSVEEPHFLFTYRMKINMCDLVLWE